MFSSTLRRFSSPLPRMQCLGRSLAPVFHRARRRVACAGSAGVVALALFANGCTPGPARPAVASGERPVTGNARYDRFFAEVSDLYGAARESVREVAEVRAALSRRVGLPDSVTVDVLGARLRERTARLAQDGLTLELEFTGIDDSEDDETFPAEGESPNADAPGSADGLGEAAGHAKVLASATLRTPGREPARRELRLLKVLAQAALSGATVYVDMERAQHRTVQLLEEAAKLDGQVSTTFYDAAQRDLVRSKLSEAEAFLPDLREQAHQAANAADVLIALLDEAANTAPEGPAPRRRPAREAPRDATAPSASDRGPRRPPVKNSEPAAAAAPLPAAPDRPTDFQP
jgi:hypothetical protein